jgi:hypothetical protein
MTSCHDQRFKGACHFAMANLATTMLLYNGLAWVTRREPRLAVNALVYASLLAFETYHTRCHWRTPPK